MTHRLLSSCTLLTVFACTPPGVVEQEEGTESLEGIDFSADVVLSDRVGPDIYDYEINEQIEVTGNLTLEAGVRIDQVGQGGFVVTTGTITAEGTVDDPVDLDFGRGLTVLSRGNSLTWVRIQDANSQALPEFRSEAALILGSAEAPAQVDMAFVTLRDSVGTGLIAAEGTEFTATQLGVGGSLGPYIELAEAAQVGMLGTDGWLSAGAQPIVRVGGGVIAQDTRFSVIEAPLRFSGNVEVAEGATLQIDSGANLRFVEDTGLIARGDLRVLGVEGGRVIFTGDAGSSGSWAGVSIEGLSSELRFVTLSNGGGTSFDDGLPPANVVVGRDGAPGMVALEAVTLSRSAGWGLAAVQTAEELDLDQITASENALGDVYTP